MHVRASPERAQAGGLDRWSIGHRVGKGHAELDQIGAGRWQTVE
jgi:hypothetical protein